MPSPTAPAQAHVVIAGIGGIGCPAAWALAESGVGRLTLVDNDIVSLHNLPRQVLFRAEDVGRRKAQAAAMRLARAGRTVTAVTERLDGTNAARLLEGAHVLIDATDGARAKDGLNLLALAYDVPLVHAAGLRSEGRLLDVPAGGRPCLACLFGRLSEEALGTCADLGVWNGVVGAVGVHAARAALRRLAQPAAPSSGYEVLDLEQRRWTRLMVAPQPDCPVCGAGAIPDPRTYVESGEPEPAPWTAAAPPGVLDLTTERCPMNLLRARQALEGAESGAVIEIWLGLEGAATVPDGVRALGHAVLVEQPLGLGLRLKVRRAWRPDPGAPEPMNREDLERFARQLVLPGVGEQGQRRLGSTRVVIRGASPGVDALRTYLVAAGVGSVDQRPGRDLAASVPGQAVAWSARMSAAGAPEVARAPWIQQESIQHERGSSSGFAPADGMLLGVLLADAVERAIVRGATIPDLTGPAPLAQ